MPYNRLSTSKIAKIVGCHPNTVRMYEAWGLLPPVPRAPNGYRLYTLDHLDQMRLARTTLNTAWPGKTIRKAAFELIHQSARGDLGGALESAYRYLVLVQTERSQAEMAAELVSRWAHGFPADTTGHGLHIRDAARHLNVTSDQLRNWERNGLLDVPKDPHNNYRLYGAPELARARVIRVLRNAGYSLMAIYRMLNQLDIDSSTDIKHALDTPRPDEDVFHATDHWLSTLQGLETTAREMIRILEEWIKRK
ncbi:MAG: MerR family transcriptional regulator [Anaerolineaceae bacterium]|nr:MerR family transcriptional regulator [Anaerolineaceae bacterium]